MKFKPKMIESLPYEVIEYLDSKPNSFIKIKNIGYQLLSSTPQIDKIIYNYYLVEKNTNYEKKIFETIQKFLKNI